jgi:hypothetical protein
MILKTDVQARIPIEDGETEFRPSAIVVGSKFFVDFSFSQQLSKFYALDTLIAKNNKYLNCI